MRFLSVAFLLIVAPLVSAQELYRPVATIPPKDLDARVAASWARHKNRLQSLPVVTATSWDSRQLGLVPPIKDQSSCGSCWNFSGTGGCESAALKAGYGKPDGSFGFSEQYTMDCYPTGKCNGDWPETVYEHGKKIGIAVWKNYGDYKAYPRAYNANSGSCQSSGLKLFTIADYGYVGSSSGVPSVQSIKDALVKYGPLSVAVAADTAWSNYRAGTVFAGRATGINHAVMIVGWDDSKGRAGAWIVRNSWGTSWGDGGYMWSEYGANQIGYGAMWCSVNALPPAPDPLPPPTPALTGQMILRIPGMADQSFDVKLPKASPNGGITISEEKYQQLQDEVKRLQELLVLQGKTPDAGSEKPCGAVKELKERLDAIEKKIESHKTATDKNLSDLIDIVDMNRKAVEALHKKTSMISPRHDSPTYASTQAPRLLQGYYESRPSAPSDVPRLLQGYYR